MATQLKTVNGFFINIKDGYELKEAYVLACNVDADGKPVITIGEHKSKKTGIEVTTKTSDVIFSNDVDGVFVYVPADRIDEVKLVKGHLTIFRPVILPSVEELEAMMK